MRIGSILETPVFYPYMSGYSNLELIAGIKGIDKKAIEPKLEIVGLLERRDSPYRTFSFGMKQRLAVAAALLGDPEVLILDEPTNGLDPQGIAHIRDIITEVASRGITIILASHLLDEVQKVCSHVAVLKKGNVLFSGKVSEVLSVSDCIEMCAANPALLINAIREHPDFKTYNEADGKVLVYFKGEPDPSDINKFLYGKGVILSHLSDRKRTLEQHFLELLQENQ